ncbi:MAG: ArsR/SmtB family transcription factor [Actinomycetota bacterium]
MDRSIVLERSGRGAAALFAALGDPARIAILKQLTCGTRCACEMGELGMAPNLLSYHLRILREAGLVLGVRTGRRVDYRLDPRGFEALREAIDRIGGGSACA